MTDRRLIDTNLIVRYLVKDHEQHSRAATELFEACDRGDLTLVLLPGVLAECVFVLESFYRRSRQDIAEVLASLINSPNVELDEAGVHLDALKRFGNSRLHFIDCTLAAYSASQKWPVATFDLDFRKFPDVKIKFL
jgi:predicted nucleic acid-binding protein